MNRIALLLPLLLLAGCQQPNAITLDSPAAAAAHRVSDGEPDATPVTVAISHWYDFEENAFGAPAFDLRRVDAWIEGHTVVVTGEMNTLPGVFGVDWSASCGLTDLRTNHTQSYPYPLFETDSTLYISGEAYNPNYSNLSYQDENNGGHLLREGPGSVSISGNVVRFTCPDSMLAFAPNAITFQAIHYVNGSRRGSDRWTALIRRWGSGGLLSSR